MFYAGPSELDVSSYLKRSYAPLGDRLAAGCGAMPIPLIRELIG